EQQGTAGMLATHLEAVLRARDVDTRLIADEVKDPVYVLPDQSGERIALRRTPAGRWQFDRETVARIPKLYAESQKHRQERNKEVAALHVAPDHPSARATVRTMIDGLRRGDYERALRCMDLDEIPPVARQQVSRQLASKLKQIIVRYQLPILQEIPD